MQVLQQFFRHYKNYPQQLLIFENLEDKSRGGLFFR